MKKRILNMTMTMLVFLLAINFSVCRAKEGTKLKYPTNMRFHYFSQGSHWEIVKKDKEIEISLFGSWTNAQLPPPDNYRPKRSIAKISENSFKKIWKKIVAFDFKSYMELKDSDFVYGPPDTMWSSGLSLEVENEQIVKWHRPYMILKDDVAKPLSKLCKTVEVEFKKGNKVQEPDLVDEDQSGKPHKKTPD